MSHEKVLQLILNGKLVQLNKANSVHINLQQKYKRAIKVNTLLNLFGRVWECWSFFMLT